jgi:hypothetical protein
VPPHLGAKKAQGASPSRQVGEGMHIRAIRQIDGFHVDLLRFFWAQMGFVMQMLWGWTEVLPIPAENPPTD